MANADHLASKPWKGLRTQARGRAADVSGCQPPNKPRNGLPTQARGKAAKAAPAGTPVPVSRPKSNPKSPAALAARNRLLEEEGQPVKAKPESKMLKVRTRVRACAEAPCEGRRVCVGAARVLT